MSMSAAEELGGGTFGDQYWEDLKARGDIQQSQEENPRALHNGQKDVLENFGRIIRGEAEAGSIDNVSYLITLHRYFVDELDDFPGYKILATKALLRVASDSALANLTDKILRSDHARESGPQYIKTIENNIFDHPAAKDDILSFVTPIVRGYDFKTRVSPEIKAAFLNEAIKRMPEDQRLGFAAEILQSDMFSQMNNVRQKSFLENFILDKGIINQPAIIPVGKDKIIYISPAGQLHRDDSVVIQIDSQSGADLISKAYASRSGTKEQKSIFTIGIFNNKSPKYGDWLEPGELNRIFLALLHIIEKKDAPGLDVSADLMDKIEQERDAVKQALDKRVRRGKNVDWDVLNSPDVVGQMTMPEILPA